jgi:hypothetical protein
VNNSFHASPVLCGPPLPFFCPKTERPVKFEGGMGRGGHDSGKKKRWGYLPTREVAVIWHVIEIADHTPNNNTTSLFANRDRNACMGPFFLHCPDRVRAAVERQNCHLLSAAKSAHNMGRRISPLPCLGRRINLGARSSCILLFGTKNAPTRNAPSRAGR